MIYIKKYFVIHDNDLSSFFFYTVGEQRHLVDCGKISKYTDMNEATVNKSICIFFSAVCVSR